MTPVQPCSKHSEGMKDFGVAAKFFRAGFGKDGRAILEQNSGGSEQPVNCTTSSRNFTTRRRKPQVVETTYLFSLKNVKYRGHLTWASFQLYGPKGSFAGRKAILERKTHFLQRPTSFQNQFAVWSRASLAELQFLGYSGARLICASSAGRIFFRHGDGSLGDGGLRRPPLEAWPTETS